MTSYDAIYVYQILEDKSLDIELIYEGKSHPLLVKFILLGRGYIDNLYVRKFKCLLAYDAEMRRIFTINEECEDFDILQKFSGHEYVGRTMKFNNKEEEHLILNDGQSITVLTELERGGYFKKFVMEKITQNKIVDFRIFEDSKLVILDKKGRISIFELYYQDMRFEKLSHLQLGVDADEMTMSLAICPRDRYLAVSIMVEKTFQQN